MQLHRHVEVMHRAAITPLGLIPLPDVEVEFLVLVRDDGSQSLLVPHRPTCPCPRHTSPN
jgi:hypothetical protein